LKEIIIINGPNLNLIGQREPLLYGSESFEDYFKQLKKEFPKAKLSYKQFNEEGKLIDAIQRAGAGVDGIVLNPAAFTHTSIGLADAVAAIDVPVVEVHISQVEARETYRQKSYVSKYVKGRISGFGLDGYRMAIDQLLRS